MRLHLWEYRRPHWRQGNGGPFPVPPDRSSLMSFEWCRFDIMFLTADTARTPGRRSRGFTPITPLNLLPMKQSIQVSYNKEYILQIMRCTSTHLSCHRKRKTILKFTLLQNVIGFTSVLKSMDIF